MLIQMGIFVQTSNNGCHNDTPRVYREGNMKEARIKVTKTIRIVGHPCKDCELNSPPIVFEGVVKDGNIDWPVWAGYHISYCPHCGAQLPKKYGTERKGK
jgi:hypothetical protein